MLVVRGIGPNQAGYYWHDPGAQQWLGAGLRALGGEPTLDARSLRCLLEGIDPTTGEILAARPAGRRAGWDLIFAAPKSVSLLAALAPGDAAGLIP
ncbi:MAG: relaxase domain-containing protein, partial [Acidimicrobiaceae bacterium]|nr:relaxase domain-containing protein [Acidimicrobiaceae bacterium]